MLSTIASRYDMPQSFENYAYIPANITEPNKQIENLGEIGNGGIFDSEMINEPSFSSFVIYLGKQLKTFCVIDNYSHIADYCRERPMLRSALVDFLRNAIAYVDPHRQHDYRISRYDDPEIEESYIDFRFLCRDFDSKFEELIDNFYDSQSTLLEGLDGWIQIGSAYV